jgi:hypothetical protein
MKSLLRYLPLKHRTYPWYIGVLRFAVSFFSFMFMMLYVSPYFAWGCVGSFVFYGNRIVGPWKDAYNKGYSAKF